MSPTGFKIPDSFKKAPSTAASNSLAPPAPKAMFPSSRLFAAGMKSSLQREGGAEGSGSPPTARRAFGQGLKRANPMTTRVESDGSQVSASRFKFVRTVATTEEAPTTTTAAAAPAPAIPSLMDQPVKKPNPFGAGARQPNPFTLRKPSGSATTAAANAAVKRAAKLVRARSRSSENGSVTTDATVALKPFAPLQKEPTVSATLPIPPAPVAAPFGGAGASTSKPMFGKGAGIFSFVKKADPQRERSASPSMEKQEKRAEKKPFSGFSVRVDSERARSGSPQPEKRAAPDKRDKLQVFQPSAVNASSLRNVGDVVRQLKSLQGKQCSGDYDKYQLLDERDRLLCKLREVNDGFFGKDERATCTELCPEKERYIRLVQKRISAYECDEQGVVDAQRALKEYARSAADQEKPLPHELRPGPVLDTAMRYLLKEIIDHPPSRREDLAAWYDFVWSRTRGVRKELTQQMLSDTTAVRLVEQCARVHISMAYRLCMLGQAEFDQRMNTENLGKCLQTLRHLYEDLQRQGIDCASEAEFRAYDMMMHLYDTNILRQVLSWRESVRNSEPVRRALALFAALQNNNWVRFFRLLRNKATFLEACLCHRYFNQVRCKALVTLSSACPRQSTYPLETTAWTLGLDGVAEAEEFVTLVGMHSEEGALVLSKDSSLVHHDELPLKPLAWIDGKLQGTRLCYVIAASTSLDYSLPQPHDSFDAHDRYVHDHVLAAYLDRLSSGSFSAPAPPAPALPAAPSLGGAPRGFGAFGGAAGGGGGGGLFGKQIAPSGDMQTAWGSAESSKSVAKAAAEKEEEERRRREEERKRQERAQMEKQTEQLLMGVCDQVTRSLVNEVLMSERMMERQRQQKEAEERERERVRMEEEQAEVRRRRTEEERRLRERQAAERRRAELAHVEGVAAWLCGQLWGERGAASRTVDHLTKQLCKTLIDKHVLGVRRQLGAVRGRLHGLWLRQFVDRWRAVVKSRAAWRARQQLAIESWPVTGGVLVDAVDSRKRRGRSDGGQSAEGEAERKKRPSSSGGGFADVSSLLVEMRISQLRRRRAERIALAAGLYWLEWARVRGEQASIVRGFLQYRLSAPVASLDGPRQFEFDQPEEPFQMAPYAEGYSFVCPGDSFLDTVRGGGGGEGGGVARAERRREARAARREERRRRAGPGLRTSAQLIGKYVADRRRERNATLNSTLMGESTLPDSLSRFAPDITRQESFSSTATVSDSVVPNSSVLTEDDLRYARDAIERTGWGEVDMRCERRRSSVEQPHKEQDEEAVEQEEKEMEQVVCGVSEYAESSKKLCDEADALLERYADLF